MTNHSTFHICIQKISDYSNLLCMDDQIFCVVSNLLECNLAGAIINLDVDCSVSFVGKMFIGCM